MALTKKSLIGKMKEVVTFKVNSGKTVSGTGFLDGYTDLLVTRGWLQNKTGTKLNEAGEILYKYDFVLTCRFQTSLESNITRPGTAVAVINNKIFSILSFTKVDEKRFYYTFNLAVVDY
jgi:hypothetical protein